VFPPSKESPSLAPELNEPLDGPSYQVGDLSIAYLDAALNAVVDLARMFKLTFTRLDKAFVDAPYFRLPFLADFLSRDI
jgi:hypothetical protein